MLTGELRHQIDRIWDAFWSGGIANPLQLLTKVVELLDAVPMEDRFRTPRHLVELMVAMSEPPPRVVMVDPACGS